MSDERLGAFAEHPASIAGGWAEDRGVREWRGNLTLAVAGRLLVLVSMQGVGFYAKSGRLAAGATAVRLRLQGPNPDGMTQLMVFAGSAWSWEARAEAALAASLVVPGTMSFRTGWLTDWAVAPGGALRVLLLALAAEDVESRRNGLWAVKPRHRDALPPIWAVPLTRTRHGVLAG